MRRRELLAGTPAILLGVAGCLGRRDNPTFPDGMTVESRHVGGIVLDNEEEIFEWMWTGDPPTAYRAVFDERSDAEDRIDHDEAMEFVRETEFDESYLLVVVTGEWTSSHELELAGIERTGSGLRIGIRSEAPEDESLQDAVYYSSVVRVTDEEAGIPDDVTVEVNDRTADTGGDD